MMFLFQRLYKINQAEKLELQLQRQFVSLLFVTQIHKSPAIQTEEFTPKL